MKNNTLKHFLKYKYSFLIFILLTILIFVFAPNQEKFYWKSDIAEFREIYFFRGAIVTSLCLIITVLIITIVKKNNLKQVINSIIGTIVLCCWFLFFFQSIILSTILFINRKFHTDQIEKQYKVVSVFENKYLYAYEIENKEKILSEEDYQKILNHKKLNEIKPNEILTIKFRKGIFGISFPENNTTANRR